MPDSTPNYLSTDAAGNVQAVFTGGVVLPIVGSGPSNNGNSVTWTKDTAGGGQVARITSTRNLISPPFVDSLTMEVDSENGSHYAKLALLARNASGGAGNPPESVTALLADGSFATILSTAAGPDPVAGSGHSDFLWASSDYVSASWLGSGSPPAITIPRTGRYICVGENGGGYAPSASGVGGYGVTITYTNGVQSFVIQWTFFFNIVDTHLRMSANYSGATVLPAGVYTPAASAGPPGFTTGPNTDGNDFYRLDLLRIGN